MTFPEIVDFELRVRPVEPGNVGGGIVVSGVTRSQDEWKRLAYRMKSEIERHCDGVSTVQIEYEYAAVPNEEGTPR
jgi:hypothetical protein